MRLGERLRYTRYWRLAMVMTWCRHPIEVTRAWQQFHRERHL